MKVFAFFLALICGCLMIYGVFSFPEWGDPNSPPSIRLSPRYIEKTMEDTSVPNVVTAVLADYRGFDTMFETTVVFAAGMACFFLLRVFVPKKPGERLYRHLPTSVTLRINVTDPETEKILNDSSSFERLDSLWVPHDLIIKNACRILIPFIQIFGLYVIAHGHHSPGGGFQGGVILGAATILLALAYNLNMASKQFSEKTISLLSSAGVFIYSGTGFLCILFGSWFLNYGSLASLFFTDPVTARSHAILLVEIGVGMAVMAIMAYLYFMLSSAGRYDEGL